MRRQIDFFKNLSVKWKFVYTYFIILVLQIVITGVYLYIQTSNSSVDEAKLVMEQNLMQTRASILEKVHVIENISPIITDDTDFQNFLGQSENVLFKIEDYQFNITPIMENIIRENSILNSISVYMPNVIFAEMGDSFYSASTETNPELYKNMLENEPAKYGWTSTHTAYDYSLNNSTQVFSFSKAIVSKVSFQNVGMLELEIKENELFDMLRDPTIRKSGEVFIVDNKNKLVSNNVPKDKINSGVVNFSTKTETSKIEMVNKIKSIVISIPIEEIGCSVVGVFPVSNFNGKVKESFINIIAVLIISSLLLGLIIYLTTSLLLGRIKRLVKAMKQVKEGNFDVSVEVDQKDEFGELGLSFNNMTLRIHDLVETVYKIEIMEREAELKALESQINPHFLYNTLATISWVARKGNSDDVIKITNSLAKFYRLVLSKGHTLISVKEEIDIVVAYLYIEKIRFQDTLNVVYDLDENIFNYRIIKNILQPIVENALSHGIADKRGNSTIIIKAKKIEDRICFQVIDDGLGMSKDKLQEVLSGDVNATNVNTTNVNTTNGSGYAIKNIMERLKAYYGKNYSFEIFSKPGVGTEVTITVGKHLEDKFKDNIRI